MVAAAGSASFSASAHATLPVRAADLVPHVSELPGYKHARMSLQATASAFKWAHTTNQGTWSEAQLEANGLEALGFEEGAVAYYHLGRFRHGSFRREAAAEAIVVSTPEHAGALMRSFTRELRRGAASEGVQVSSDPDIPGSVEVGGFTARKGGYDNVLFTSGRCVFLIGDFLRDARSLAEAMRAPRAAALAVEARLETGPCAHT
jgi:hypothetical protein